MPARAKHVCTGTAAVVWQASAPRAKMPPCGGHRHPSILLPQHDRCRSHRSVQAPTAGASTAQGESAGAGVAQRVSVPRGRGDLGDRRAGGRFPARLFPSLEAIAAAFAAPDRRRHPAASRARHADPARRRLRACGGRGRRDRHRDGALAPRRGHLPAAGEHRRADPRPRLCAAVPAVVRARQHLRRAAGRLRLGLPDHLQHLDRREGREGNLGALRAGDGRRRPAPVPPRHPAGRAALHPHRPAARPGAGLAHPGRRRDARRRAVGTRLDDFRRARVPQHGRDAGRRRGDRDHRPRAREARVPAAGRASPWCAGG